MAPTIIVCETMGWRPFLGQMACLEFQDMESNRFSLAFERGRFYEALATVISANGMFATMEQTPTMPAKKVWRKIVDGETVVFIELAAGGTIGFRLSGGETGGDEPR